MSLITNSSLVIQKALELGFSACGIAPARKLAEEEQRLKNYLENNYHGTMDYMANHFEKRLDPTLLVPGAKSVVVVLLNYFTDQLQGGNNVPIISKYAYGKDYHLVIKDKLEQLLFFIQKEIAPAEGRVFTDSAPVLERAWAVQAGLGWIGKNGLLLNKELGSFFFIGELFVDLELEYHQPFEKEYCGSCNKCLDTCPTQALIKPHILDSRRCISYLTIELKDDISDELKPLLTNRVFGCDICQDVCPWNRHLKTHKVKEFNPDPGFLKMNRENWVKMDQIAFDHIFQHSSVKRTGFQKLKMNIDSIISDSENN
jgi:epoxyqueuosine reductase